MADCETKIGAFGVFSRFLFSGTFYFSYSGSCEIIIGLFALVDFVCVRGKEFMCLLVVASVDSVTFICFVSTLGGLLSTSVVYYYFPPSEIFQLQGKYLPVFSTRGYALVVIRD